MAEAKLAPKNAGIGAAQYHCQPPELAARGNARRGLSTGFQSRQCSLPHGLSAKRSGMVHKSLGD